MSDTNGFTDVGYNIELKPVDVTGERWKAERTSTPPPSADDRARAEREQIEIYVRNMAHYMAKRYPAVANFEVLPDVLGMLSQIDNMTVGLFDERDRLTRERDEAREALDAVTQPGREACEELRVLIEAQYAGQLEYPSQKRRYERDIAIVERLASALSAARKERG